MLAKGKDEGIDLRGVVGRFVVGKAVEKEPQGSDSQLGDFATGCSCCHLSMEDGRTLLLTMPVTVLILVLEHDLLIARCGSKVTLDIFLFIFQCLLLPPPS